jgi:hypothetical protein
MKRATVSSALLPAMVLLGWATAAATGPGPTATAQSPRTLRFTDRVGQIKETPDRFRVFFRVHAAIYRLPKEESRGCRETLEALSQSLTAATPVEVEVDPFALTILSARPAAMAPRPSVRP